MHHKRLLPTVLSPRRLSTNEILKCSFLLEVLKQENSNSHDAFYPTMNEDSPPSSPQTTTAAPLNDEPPSLGDWSPTSRKKIEAELKEVSIRKRKERIEQRKREAEIEKRERDRYRTLKKKYTMDAARDVLEARQLSLNHRLTEIIFLRMALKGQVARVVGRVPSGRS